MNHLDQKVRYSPDVCESDMSHGYSSKMKLLPFHFSSVLQPVNRKCIQALRERRKLPKEFGGNFQKSSEKREYTGASYAEVFFFFFAKAPNAHLLQC